MNMAVATMRKHRKAAGWMTKLCVVMFTLACANAQDISACCDKAVGTCRSVCDKMSLAEVATVPVMREERIQNIYKFCAPQLTEFWICMNKTIQEVVSGSEWWGRACCALGRAASCRSACATAKDASALTPACRRSDELAVFDCVQRQQEAQWCCSQTQSMSCHEACQKVLWKVGEAHVDINLKEKAVEQCEQSPPLLQCLKDLTTSTVHTDTAKYLPCCHQSPSQDCRKTCEAVLRRTGEAQEIAEGLAQVCGAPAIHDELWQCFLRKDAPADSKDVIPHDAAKLHCCHKATTINCKRLCFNTYNNGWHNNWQKFYAECLGDPQENDLAQCLEEVEAPCSLGCSGLTYCSQLNNRPTGMFRSCSAQADLDAHLAVAQQRDSGFVTVSGMRLPLKNTSQCTSEIWKGIACALHVKPCTPKGGSSLLCADECVRWVSGCVSWSAAGVSARALCDRLAPRSRAAPCVPLAHYFDQSPEPALLSAEESVTSPCAGAPCNASQLCVVNRNCEQGAACTKYTCLDGCPLGSDSPVVVPLGWWARVPMPNPNQKACFKLCRCGHKGLTDCQPLPCVGLDHCRMHDKVVPHGSRFWMECNACACSFGSRVCSRRACGGGALLTRLPCNCPPHHVPVRTDTPPTVYANACLARCAGASDAEISFGPWGQCAGASCGRGRLCLPRHNHCLSRLQTACPQHYCVSTSNCKSQPRDPVCDTAGRAHRNACHLLAAGARLAYWGGCLASCQETGQVCGVNGITYMSECAAWAEYVSVDYYGPCLAVGPISDDMEPKCQIDRIMCPPLKAEKCLGFTAPGACCPKCGGGIRVLYSKKQIDRVLYGTNISASIINIKNILTALDRQVTIAECALRGYLTIEQEIFVSVESVLKNPTDLQLKVCVLEAEKIADMINRESPVITSDLGLSSFTYALLVHSYPSKGFYSASCSIAIIMISYVIVSTLN